MTFASDGPQLSFHNLPTRTQFEYSELDKQLGEQGSSLQIVAVQPGETLEVLIRITHYISDAASSGPGRD